MIKLIYQYEALKTSGEISRNKAYKNIKAAFKRLMSANYGEFFDNSAYKAESVNNHIVKILIQAVGRICRTKNKNSNIDIYVDEKIFEQVDFSVAFKNGRMLNPEFRRVAELNLEKPSHEISLNLNKANDRNMRVKTRIENILNTNRVSWSESDVEQWNFMREFVLKYPTISKEELDIERKKHYSIKDFYLEACNGEKINHYFYVDESDKESQIFYAYNKGKISSALTINDSGTRLPSLVRIPAVRKVFESNGYAMAFKKNDCIILPVVYQNIYKGALGEVAGRAILEDKGIKLEEITDATKFEKFDFCLAKDGDIYIDFKNWSENDQVDREDYRKKCLSKLEKIGGKMVFIINVAANNFQIHRSYGGRIIEISSLCKKKGQAEMDYLYELDPSDMNKVVNLLLGDGNGGEM